MRIVRSSIQLFDTGLIDRNDNPTVSDTDTAEVLRWYHRHHHKYIQNGTIMFAVTTGIDMYEKETERERQNGWDGKTYIHQAVGSLIFFLLLRFVASIIQIEKSDKLRMFGKGEKMPNF